MVKDFNDLFDFLEEVTGFGSNNKSYSYYSKEIKGEDDEVLKKVEKEYKNGECTKDYTYEKSNELENKCSKETKEETCEINWKDKYLSLCEKYGELEAKNIELKKEYNELKDSFEEIDSENECIKHENAHLKARLKTIRDCIKSDLN